MTSKTLGPFLGINNRLPDHSLWTKEGTFVRQADNVDLLNDGNFKRRKTARLLQASTRPHSLHGRYLVRDSALYEISLPNYAETLVKVLSSDSRMSFVDVDGDCYFSNGADSGRISAGAVYPIGLPLPAEPEVAAIPGELPPGWYQVAVSYKNADTGEEGGVSPSQNFHLQEAGALRVTLPGGVVGASHVNVYVSALNGSIPLLQVSAPVGSASVDIEAVVLGREAVQRYEAPLPAGRLFWFNGCLCSYQGNCVYEGLPFRPGYYLPSEGRVPFPEQVSNCAPAQNGIYIVADKTYWIPGTRITTAEDVIQDVLPYGGVYGTEFTVPHKSQYGWFGKKGFVIGTPSGEVQAVMTENVSVQEAPPEGFSVVFEDGGHRRVVSCGYCLNLETLGVTTYSDWEFSSIDGLYATKEDGVWVFDDSLPVEWLIDLGKQNFATEHQKYMPSAYAGYASSEPLVLSVSLPNGASYSYAAKDTGAEIALHRFDLGRGLRSNWFGLTLNSQAGEDFILASVSFSMIASNRRI